MHHVPGDSGTEAGPSVPRAQDSSHPHQLCHTRLWPGITHQNAGRYGYLKKQWPSQGQPWCQESQGGRQGLGSGKVTTEAESQEGQRGRTGGGNYGGKGQAGLANSACSRWQAAEAGLASLKAPVHFPSQPPRQALLHSAHSTGRPGHRAAPCAAAPPGASQRESTSAAQLAPWAPRCPSCHHPSPGIPEGRTTSSSSQRSHCGLKGRNAGPGTGNRTRVVEVPEATWPGSSPDADEASPLSPVERTRAEAIPIPSPTQTGKCLAGRRKGTRIPSEKPL